MNVSPDDLLKIRDWAARHPKIEKVFLYGSRARGDNREDSDIDLAIWMSYSDWFFWHIDFEKAPDLHLSHQVDLQWYMPDQGLERVGPGVERDGILIYEVAPPS